jgi:lipoprotein-anchoring transpeptidase ErfK/SrfK
MSILTVLRSSLLLLLLSCAHSHAQGWAYAEPPPQAAAPTQSRGLFGVLFNGNGAQPQPQAYAQPYAPRYHAVQPRAQNQPPNYTYFPAEQEPQSRVRAPRVSASASEGFSEKFSPQTVNYSGPHNAGTIIIDTGAKYLYFVLGNGEARRYGVGVGREGFQWRGVKNITRKAEWPDWRPPPEMLKRRPDLPRFMAGGLENPLGARAMYLGSSMYRIHGTNEPHTIGHNVSSGCFRMRNQDVEDLYSRVRVGTRVVVT